MFHWICPECGREIPPAVKECSTCDPQAAPAPAPVASVPLTPLLTSNRPDPLLNLAQKLRDAQRDFQAAPREVRQNVEPIPTPVAVKPQPSPNPSPGPSPIVAPIVAPAAPVAPPLAAPQISTLLLPAAPSAVALLAPVEIIPPAAPVVEIPKLSELSEPSMAGQAVAAQPESGPVESSHVGSSDIEILPPAAPAVEIPTLSELAEPSMASQAVAAEPSEISAVSAPVEPSAPSELSIIAEILASSDPAPVASAQAEPEPAAEATANPVPAPDTAPSAPAPALALNAPPALPAATPEPPPEPTPAPEAAPAPDSMPVPELALTAVAPVAAPELPAETPISASAPEPVNAPEPQPEPALSAIAPAPEPQSELQLAPPDPAAAGRIPTPEPALSAFAPASKPPEEPAALAAAVPPPPSVKPIQPGPAALILAPLQDSSSLGRRIRPASPAVVIMRSDTGPRVTLPGPALPRALNSLEDAGIAKILVDHPKNQKAASRGWVTGVLVAVVMLASFLGLELYNSPRSSASASPAPVAKESIPVAPAPAPTVTPSTVASAASYPLSKAVEVTGLRFVGDKKPEVHYLVVNHSSAELSAVTVYVSIRASASKPPLYHFSFRSPTLAPFESKEMVSSIDKLLHTPADWQSLHADVEVGQ